VANYPSAKKRIRQTERRTVRNKHIRSTVRTTIKRVRVALTEGNAEQAREALSIAERKIDQAVSKGVYHYKTGARYISRLAHQVAALGK
jgi:small subunit ribosomal protein S20